jgi:5-methylcytosine-specific restriction endonuclease McrA
VSVLDTERVLVLNRLWQAVNIIASRRALTLLFMGHARVLSAAEESWQVWPAKEWLELSHTHPACPRDRWVHTARRPIRLPKIILLNHYAALPIKPVHLSRQAIFERDGYCCQYCGSKLPAAQLNLDHVLPRERGGKMRWENIVTSCISCNSLKSNRTPKEANMRLIKTPRQPKSRPFISYIIGQQIDPAWRDFLEARHEEADVELVATLSAQAQERSLSSVG